MPTAGAASTAVPATTAAPAGLLGGVVGALVGALTPAPTTTASLTSSGLSGFHVHHWLGVAVTASYHIDSLWSLIVRVQLHASCRCTCYHSTDHNCKPHQLRFVSPEMIG